MHGPSKLAAVSRHSCTWIMIAADPAAFRNRLKATVKLLSFRLLYEDVWQCLHYGSFCNRHNHGAQETDHVVRSADGLLISFG